MAWWFAAPVVLWGAKKLYETIVDDDAERSSTINVSESKIRKAKAERTRYRKKVVKEVLNEYRKHQVANLNEEQGFYEDAVFDEKSAVVTLEASAQSAYLLNLKKAVNSLGGNFDDSEEKASSQLINSDRVAKSVLEGYSASKEGSFERSRDEAYEEGFNTSWEYVPGDDPFHRVLLTNLERVSDELKNSNG